MKKSPFLSPVLYHAISHLTKTKRKLEKIKLVKTKKKPMKIIESVPQPKIFCRNTILPVTSVGYSFIVHNGKAFLKVYVSEKMIGHKLGEFSQTRRRYFFKKKGKRKR